MGPSSAIHARNCRIAGLHNVYATHLLPPTAQVFSLLHICHSKAVYRELGRVSAVRLETCWKAELSRVQGCGRKRCLRSETSVVPSKGWPLSGVSHVVQHDSGDVLVVGMKRGISSIKSSSLAGISGGTSPRRLPNHLSISSDKASVDIEQLKQLFELSGYQCDLLATSRRRGNESLPDPQRGPDISTVKLQRALQHSTVIVSMCMPADAYETDFLHTVGHSSESPTSEPGSAPLPEGGPPEPWHSLSSGWWNTEWLFPEQGPRRLVAFGRAFSDTTLTASIHDIVVAPPLQRMGLGTKVIFRIIRELRKLGIQDISALSSPQSRGFLKACKFGPDNLGATTMLYTRGFPPTVMRSGEHVDSEIHDTNCKKQWLLEPPPLTLPMTLNRPLFAPLEPQGPRPRNRKTAIWQREKHRKF